MRDKPFKEVVKLAKHYKAVGQTDVYLPAGDTFPWEHVVSVEEGSTHRLGIPVSLSFRANHPSGLVFRWFFDIEKSLANGKSTYEIDVPRVRAVLLQLRGIVRKEMQQYLSRCAEQIQKRADEYFVAAREQQAYADAFRALAIP